MITRGPRWQLLLARAFAVSEWLSAAVLWGFLLILAVVATHCR